MAWEWYLTLTRDSKGRCLNGGARGVLLHGDGLTLDHGLIRTTVGQGEEQCGSLGPIEL